MKKILLLLSIVLLAAGCATSGPKFAELAPELPALSKDAGRIYIYRITALGAALQPNIVVNGQPVGKSKAKGFIYLDEEPGNYVIETATEVKRKLSLTLDAGETLFVRLGVSWGFFVGHVYPELVEPEVGKKEIQSCHYLDPAAQGK